MKHTLTLLSAFLITMPFELHAEETLVYKKVGSRELKLFVDKPADWKVTDRRPGIVFYFGGGWVGGSAASLIMQSEYLATRGMVGVRVEYRILPKGDPGPPLTCIADAKSAMRYVRAHAAELGIDPQRIAGSGSSAGGHLAAFTSLVEGLDDAFVFVACGAGSLGAARAAHSARPSTNPHYSLPPPRRSSSQSRMPERQSGDAGATPCAGAQIATGR